MRPEMTVQPGVITVWRRRTSTSEKMFFGFNIFTIFTVCSIFHVSHGFEVIQPESRTINPDQSVLIRCSHNSPGSLQDVRLWASKKDGTEDLLCQKGEERCRNIVLYEEDSKNYVFIILNVGEEEMKQTYRCEFSVTEKSVDLTKQGNPTKLLQDRSTGSIPVTTTVHTEVSPQDRTEPAGMCASPNPLPLSAVAYQLMWILIGLLALLFLYSCVITFCYIKLLQSNEVCENSTYVEMRKAPAPWGPGLHTASAVEPHHFVSFP